MTPYEQILNRLFQTIPSALRRKGLEVAQRLDTALNYPTTSYPTIHIAGSNGKGSVSTKIATSLALSGYRVGLYTSPHLFSFCERIVINQKPIEEEAVIRGLQRLFALKFEKECQPTFFELTTFLAFEHFKEEKVDVAVIETGIGGKCDATNILRPLLTIITSISREHVPLLGNDLEQIAEEKAGILKPKVPLILGPKARLAPIYNRALELQCPLFASKKISCFFDEENSAVAELALEHLSSTFLIRQEALATGLSIRPPCRFEKIGNVLFDVAHNPDAVFHLLQALHTFYPNESFRFLVGFSKDKEYHQCLDLICNTATHIHLVQAPSFRAASVEELQKALDSQSKEFSSTHSSIEEGMREARAAAAAKGEKLVVCGSFYIMAEAKKVFENLRN